MKPYRQNSAVHLGRPDIIQAGVINYGKRVASAFVHHRGAWPDRISYFAHDVN